MIDLIGFSLDVHIIDVTMKILCSTFYSESKYAKSFSPFIKEPKNVSFFVTLQIQIELYSK